jgi:Soluble lytic murein transglycosylase and related regulatory proteins (some contain LysM/invasin domains)
MVLKIKSTAKLIIMLIIILGAVMLLKASYKSFINNAYPIKFEDKVLKYSKEFEVEPELVFSVIRTESHFNKFANSYANAKGLMQLTPETFEWLQTKISEDNEYTEDDLYDEDINIKYGTKFLQILVEEFEDYETVACAYHAGRGNVNDWLNDEKLNAGNNKLVSIPINETKVYAGRVLDTIKIYKSILKEKEILNEYK